MSTGMGALRYLLPVVRPLAPLALALLVLIGAVIAPGCAAKKQGRPLTPPEMVVAPYSSLEGEVLWAVAPPRNESGTSYASSEQVADALVASAAEVRGVRVLPLNRTLGAMRALRMEAVETPAQARQLAQALGVDAIIVGTITAWDPYNPPVIGLSLALMGLTGPDGEERFDPRALVSSPTDHDPRGGAIGAGLADERPMALVSEHLDARNHQVLADLRNYATGRHDPRDALTWEVHLASMELYAKFAAHYCVARLVQQEWIRLAQESGRE